MLATGVDLGGREVRTRDTMAACATELAARYATAVLVKGRSNYLCQRRLEQARGRQMAGLLAARRAAGR